MARWAIGDLQGCSREFDLVNRGPESLQALRRVRSLSDNLIVVLGNHDLHLLALAFVPDRRPRRSDTLDDILAAHDREQLIGWLLRQPLVHHDAARGDLLIHAGLVPQWSAVQAAALAREVQEQLRHDPGQLLGRMYGDEPDTWDDSLAGIERARFVINVLTRLRVCTARGRVDLKQKGPPHEAQPPWMPWFQVPGRATRNTRVIFGHWSALGFMQRAGLLALDTGCVWGGSLTAVNLDDATAPPVSVPALNRVER
jgi:bis(5'-nucleosyl)-tetraphosphatase (symmetrical)